MDQDHSQLNLFSWQKETLGEGYEKLAAFCFDEAESVFVQINEKYVSTDPETEEALFCTNYWKEVFDELENISPVKAIPFLYKEVSRFNFSNTWGQQQFRSALIRHLIRLMQQQNIFYLNDQIALSDLFLQIKQTEKAEQALTEQLSTNEQDNKLRFRLAQIQWKNGLKGEAKRNYTLGLLLNPTSVPLEFLESDEIADLIDKYGSEMTPAYGWVFGVLPLLRLPDEFSVSGDSHLKALHCYRLLRKAEKASKGGGIDECVKYRKAMKETSPEFYDEYFALISKRKLIW